MVILNYLDIFIFTFADLMPIINEFGNNYLSYLAFRLVSKLLKYLIHSLLY